MTAPDETPEVIAVSLQKGGTGKTFTAMNLAGGLAARGFEVLLVDFDPQGTLSANLGKREQYFDLDTLSLDEVLLDPSKWDRVTELIETDHEEFDLVPANQSYNGNKTPLDAADAGGNRFGRLLEHLEGEYHYVVCDCPPDFSPYAKNAVTAGENIVIPMIPEMEMPHSVDLLFDQYDVLEMMHELDISYLASVMTVDSTKMTSEHQRIVSWFEDTFGEKGVVTDHRAAFARAKKNQRSVYAYEESLANAELETYDRLVELVMAQTEPPTFGIDVEAATQLSLDGIRRRREQNREQEVNA
ncbi:chromosome partitioning protein [Halostagnicola sp. A56]|uniref:ParA family protein n=1 Tax=Halostagnicola sp. A56 TaxID=1495067 RepID=UPI0004A081CA|nr:ParA family protein [Halostagnicola sp. A56]KDE60190.1 chromosome partitioning protein [Halostagnicola sp. A56]